MLITGKIKEAVTRRHEGKPVYDAVVVDAPPTGRITRFLGVTAEMATLARSGPIKTQSDGVMAVLNSKRIATGEPLVGFANPLLYDIGSQNTGSSFKDAINQIIAPTEPVARGSYSSSAS